MTFPTPSWTAWPGWVLTASPFTSLRLPKMFDLRMGPYERADITSNTYWDWLIDHAFLLVPAQAYVGQFLAIFKEFPQRQKAESFNLDAVLRKMSEGGGSKYGLFNLDAHPLRPPLLRPAAGGAGGIRGKGHNHEDNARTHICEHCDGQATPHGCRARTCSGARSGSCPRRCSFAVLE
jgi:hypothetical protein